MCFLVNEDRRITANATRSYGEHCMKVGVAEVRVNARDSHEAKVQSGLHMHVAYLVALDSRAPVSAMPCD